MTLTEVEASLRVRVGQAVRVTPIAGDPETLLVVSVDQEGFTYRLSGLKYDPEVLHWWAFEDVSGVESG